MSDDPRNAGAASEVAVDAGGDGASGKRWGGRFGKDTHALVEAYGSSVEQDRALIPYDIRGSIAHATMLGRQGIIPRDKAEAILDGLRGQQRDAEQGQIEL